MFTWPIPGPCHGLSPDAPLGLGGKRCVIVILWEAKGRIRTSPNGAQCDSPGCNPGLMRKKESRPEGAELGGTEIAAPIFVAMFRPCRAWLLYCANSQGVAQGYHMTPRWGWDSGS